MAPLLATVACLQSSDPRDIISTEARDAEVYATVLDSMFARPNAKRISQLVVSDSTSVFRREVLIAGVIEAFYDFDYVDSTAVRSFEAQSRNSRPIQRIEPLASKTPVVLVSSTSLGGLPRGVDAYWRRFYELYPQSGGIILLSPVGYNAKGDVAILMVDQGCGGLCGNGYRVGLRRKAGKWYIATMQRTWVS